MSLIEHSHKNIDIDRPGRDSYRLRESGCMGLLPLGNDRWALMHELRGDAEPPLDYLLDRMQHCDRVLIEGFKSGGFPRLEVWRPSVGRSTLWPEWPGIVGIATDGVLPVSDVQRLELADAGAIADFVLAHAAERRGRAAAVGSSPAPNIVRRSALCQHAREHGRQRPGA